MNFLSAIADRTVSDWSIFGFEIGYIHVVAILLFMESHFSDPEDKMWNYVDTTTIEKRVESTGQNIFFVLLRQNNKPRSKQLRSRTQCKRNNGASQKIYILPSQCLVVVSFLSITHDFIVFRSNNVRNCCHTRTVSQKDTCDKNQNMSGCLYDEKNAGTWQRHTGMSYRKS